MLEDGSSSTGKADFLLDMIDHEVFVRCEDYWCPCTLKSVELENGQATVDYLGWGPTWKNTKINLSSIRKPNDNLVLKCKAWVDMERKEKDMPYWPCIVYIRRSCADDGIDFLMSESRIFVRFTGARKAPVENHMGFDQGKWLKTKLLRPFVKPGSIIGSRAHGKRKSIKSNPAYDNILEKEVRFYEQQTKLGMSHSKFKEQFAEALAAVDAFPSAVSYLFKLDGNSKIDFTSIFLLHHSKGEKNAI